MAIEQVDPLHIALAGAIVGATAGALATWIGNWIVRENRARLERRAAKEAIEAEVDYAATQAEGYLKSGTPDNVGWRLPTSLYSQAAPMLLAQGALNNDAQRALLAYYGIIESFNRSLDAAQEHRSMAVDQSSPIPAMLVANEIGRARTKALHLLPSAVMRKMLEDPSSTKASVEKMREFLGKAEGGADYYDKVRRALSLA